MHIRRPFRTSQHHFVLCAFWGVPFARHPARSAKIGGTPDKERPYGRIRARTACAALRPARDPPAPLSPAPASARKSAPPSPAHACRAPAGPLLPPRSQACANDPSQIAPVGLGDVQKGRPKSHIGTAIQCWRSFPMCDLERPFCTSGGTRAQGKRGFGGGGEGHATHGSAPPRAPTGARSERAARQGHGTARRPSPGRGRRGAKGHPWGTRGGLSPDPFGDMRKGRPESHAPRAI